MFNITHLRQRRLSIAITSCLVGSFAAHAQTDASDKLETMVVTASGFEQSLTHAPASISVVTRQDLETKHFRDLAEALSDVEGVDVHSATGKTGGLNISIRGMPSEYTLILIDGRRQNVAGDVTPNGFGEALTSFMPPISAIERIEVIRGPMSTLYGSDAVGGVVNIITRKVANQWGGSVSLSQGLPQDRAWGSTQKANFYVNGPLVDDLLGLAVRGSTYHREASDWILAPGATQSGRNPAPAETRQYNLGSRLTYTPTQDHEIFFDVDLGNNWYNNEDGRLGNRDQSVIDAASGSLPGYKDFMRLKREQFILGHGSKLGEGYLESSLSYATIETQGRTIPGKYTDIGNSYAGYPNIIVGDDRELKTTNTILDTKYVTSFIDGHTTTLGGQYWDAEIKDGLIPSTLDQRIFAFFLENEWTITDDLALTLGGRYDKHDAFGGHFSPRAYLVYSAFDHLTIKGGINRGFRAPNLNQLADGISGVGGQGTSISIGNPNLKPETSTNTELGFLYNNQDGLATSITFFHNKVEDRISSGGDCSIDWISSCSANPTAGYSINIDEAKTWGAELTARIDLPADVVLSMNYTWTDSEIKENGEKNGKLGNLPKHLANATVRWAASEELSLWLKGNYRGKARRFSGDYDKLAGNDKLAYDAVGDLKSYVLFDLGAAYKASNDLSLNASVTNLLDKDLAKFSTYTNTNNDQVYIGEYFHSGRSTTGGVLPGRTFWLAANYNF